MPSSQPEKYSRNVLFTYLNAVVVALMILVMTPILTHHLGVTRFGVWVLIGSLIPYFELVELGFANSTISYVAKHREAGGAELIHRTLNTSFFVLMLPGLLAAALALVVAVYLPDIVHSIPPDLIGQARILLLLLAFDMAVSIPMDTFGGALVALQRFDLLNATLISVTVLQAIAWVVVLQLHGGLVALGVVTVVIGLCGQGARYLLARRLVPQLSVSLRAVDRSILRSFLGLSGWFSLGEVSAAVNAGVDVIIVGIVVGVRGAALFAVAARLASIPTQASTPPSLVLFPYAGQMAGRDDHQGLRNLTTQVTRQVMALAVPAALVVIALSDPAVRAWVGPSYHESARLAVVLAAAAIVTSLAVIPNKVVSGSGRPKVPTTISGVETVVHIGLCIAFCYEFGVIGAALAVLSSVVLFEGLILLPTLYRMLGIPVVTQIVRLLRAHAVPVLVSGVLGWGIADRWLEPFVKDHHRVESMVAVIVVGLVVVSVYYAIFYFTGMDRSERGAVADRIRLKFARGSAV
jgi:O-antigen/teichoic acid export membrane protein